MQTETVRKEFKDHGLALDPEWELAAIKAKIPEEPKTIVQAPPSPAKPPRGKFEDTGKRGENTGRQHDVSGFSDKEKKPEEEKKVGKLDASDYAFLNKDKDAGAPKRKTGKKIIRDSPFKKSTTITDDGNDSPISKQSGFKRQLTSGSRKVGTGPFK